MEEGIDQFMEVRPLRGALLTETDIEACPHSTNYKSSKTDCHLYSFRRKCPYRFTPFSTYKLYHYSILLLLFGLLHSAGASSFSLNCRAVRNHFGAEMKFKESKIPKSARAGLDLKICSRGMTCCNKKMEAALYNASKLDYEGKIAAPIFNLKVLFETRASNFDKFFSDLLVTARRSLEDMFATTYGAAYTQNKHIFDELFQDLTLYYKGRNLDLADVFERFFSALLQRMFQLLNVNFLFDKEYLQCISDSMDKLKPFGPDPRVITERLTHAFVAARTFVHSLGVGKDVLLVVNTKVSPSASCYNGFTKMSYCAVCQAAFRIPPCHGYCLNVLRGCLAYQSELSQAWDQYVDALLEVASRLEGQFNVVQAIEPLHLHLSTAIMNFQDNAKAVQTKVIQGCGKLQPRKGGRNTRSKRDALPLPNRNLKRSPSSGSGTGFDKLMKSITRKLKSAEGFWSGFSEKVCKDEMRSSNPQATECWNGAAKGRYTKSVQAADLKHQRQNPEVEVTSGPNRVISEQLINLRTATNNLKIAAEGGIVNNPDDSDVSDDSEETIFGRGSGVGDDEDDVLPNAAGSGSGDNNAYEERDKWDWVRVGRKKTKAPWIGYTVPVTRAPGGSASNAILGDLLLVSTACIVRTLLLL